MGCKKIIYMCTLLSSHVTHVDNPTTLLSFALDYTSSSPMPQVSRMEREDGKQ